MGTGYTRTDTADNIANGNVIDADDLDTEFNAIESAFSSSTGHTHDGTSAEGAPIEVIGPAQDIVATTTVLRPKTTATVDLGTSSLKYKDVYLSGDINLDGSITSSSGVTIGGTLSVSSNTTVGGTLGVTGNTTLSGNTTLGDAATDTVTVNADVASHLIPSVDDSYDLGAVGSEWRNAYIDGTAYIDTGSIDTANVVSLNVSGNAAVTGTITGDVTGDVTGNADTATALATPRTIAIAGATSGSANFDGSTNITITTSGLTLGGTTVTATGAELNTLAGMTASTNELNTLDGITASTSELNILDGATLSTAELNILDGITASTTELNYMDGVTSNVQTQLDGKLGSLSTYTGDIDIDGELVVTSYNETFSSVSSSGGATIVNAETGNVFSHTLTENTTFTFTNPPLSGTAYGFALKIVQDASASGYTVTWPSAVLWPFSFTPTLSDGANEIDQFAFYTHDGGTTWYGFVAGRTLG
jgi:hypothetical protein